MWVLRRLVLVGMGLAATFVMLLFTAPSLPTADLVEGEPTRQGISVTAVVIAIVAVTAILVLTGVWSRELGALRPARIGWIALALAMVVSVTFWIGTVALMMNWNVVPLRPEGSSGARSATLGWLALMAGVTGYWCWDWFRERALVPILRQPPDSTGPRRVVGRAALIPGLPTLIDPVSGRPSLAWTLRATTTQVRQVKRHVQGPTNLVAPDPNTGQQMETVSETTHGESGVIDSRATPFRLYLDTRWIDVDAPRMTCLTPKRVNWHLPDARMYRLIPESTRARLKELGHAKESIGTSALFPGDILTVRGIVRAGASGALELTHVPSLTWRFWSSTLHGVEAYARHASRGEAKRRARTMSEGIQPTALD